MDGNDFGPYGTSTHPSHQNGNTFLGSLRGRPPLDDGYSCIDMPHTATTCAGPSRGLIKESSLVSLDENANPPKSTERAKHGLSKIYPFSMTNAGREGMSFVKKLEASLVGRGKRRNTVSNTPATTRTTISFFGSSPGMTVPASRNSYRETTPNSLFDSKSSVLTIEEHGIHTPHSSKYSEGKYILKQLWNEGWSAAFEDIKDRKRLERTYRYGSAGKKIPVYMHGALPNGSRKIQSFSARIVSWKISRQRLNHKDGGGGEDVGFQGGMVGSYIDGGSMSTSAVMDMGGTDGAGGYSNSPVENKKSAFTEMFERGRMSFSRERAVASGSKTPEVEMKRRNKRKKDGYLGHF